MAIYIQNLAKLHGGFQPLYHGMLKNHGRWVQLIDEREVAIYQRVEDQKALGGCMHNSETKYNLSTRP